MHESLQPLSCGGFEAGCWFARSAQPLRPDPGPTARNSRSGWSQDTCQLEAPGIYYFRLGAAAQSLRYNLTVAYEKEVSRSTEIPPGFDVAPVLAPGVAREVTVCAPFGKWYQIQMAEPGTVAVESALDYAGYYLDFTLTNEDGLTLSYWPQGAGDTRQELKLDRGRFLVRVRSVRSGCRTFSLTLSHVGRRF